MEAFRLEFVRCHHYPGMRDSSTSAHTCNFRSIMCWIAWSRVGSIAQNHFVDPFKDEQTDDVSWEHFIYQLIHKKRVQESFPNVEIALRILYVVLMISNCSAERSFSKMKLIKNRLRTSACNDRLSHMVLMSIESDILREINVKDLVTEFAKKKLRKVSLQ